MQLTVLLKVSSFRFSLSKQSSYSLLELPLSFPILLRKIVLEGHSEIEIIPHLLKKPTTACVRTPSGHPPEFMAVFHYSSFQKH